MKTSSIYGRLRRVFSTSENKQLHERLARLIVLYEDLRLETSGMTNKEELPKLDDSGFAARQSYFLRRTFGTLSEFAEAIRLTETCREFLTILKPTLSPEDIKTWDSAVAFFKGTEHRIKSIRNDIGGHFGAKAVEYSLANLDRSILADMEIYEISPGIGGVRFRFAPYIANTAMLRHATGSTLKDQLEELIGLVNEAMSYAVPGVAAISIKYLRDRFRQSA